MTQNRHGRLAALALGLAFAVAGLAAPSGASARTVWLCRPGLRHDPCVTGLSTTRISPSGRILGRVRVRAVRHPSLDCFYVYPTVSDEKKPEADLRVGPEERSIALYQVARYSQLCRVYAPMYRQITLAGLLNLGSVTPAMAARAYGDVRAAWLDYLRHYNHGRGVVLIGHSQGSIMLRQLISKEIDPSARARRRLVSAILLGGNTLVRKGRQVGGDFRHIRPCHSRTQLGCVITFSTFDQTPPANAIFGQPIPFFGIGPKNLNGLSVVCTNPAALGGGSGRLDPVFPEAPFAPGTALGGTQALIGFPVPKVRTTWIEADGAYSARCGPAPGGQVLMISPRAGAPMLHPVPDATWGLHLVDANIALGNLVDVVRAEAARYAHR